MVDYLGENGFVWWQGVVEDINDPLQLGRCRVRIFGYHSRSKSDIPTEDLPWAHPIQPLTDAAISGIGNSPTGLVAGSHVMGFFRDGTDAQQPVMFGSIGGIPLTRDASPLKLYQRYVVQAGDTLWALADYDLSKVYVVAEGDNLFQISGQSMSEVDRWMEANPQIKNENEILAGDVLYSPEAKERLDYDTATKEQRELAGKKRNAWKFANPQITDWNNLQAGTELNVPDFVEGEMGFTDPDGVYPEYEVGQPDTNKLARGIRSGIVVTKEKNRQKYIPRAEIPKALGDVPSNTKPNWQRSESTPDNLANNWDREQKGYDLGGNYGNYWDEHIIQYNAKYPDNKVFQTKGGHIQEFDDSIGSSRIHTYHNSGTFTEIKPVGSKVEKIMRDNYNLILGDDYVHVGGNVKIMVGPTGESSGAVRSHNYPTSNISILVRGDADIQVDRNINAYVGQNLFTNVAGNATAVVSGAVGVRSKKTIALVSDGDITIESGKDITIQSGPDGKIDLNPGKNTPGLGGEDSPSPSSPEHSLQRDRYVT